MGLAAVGGDAGVPGDTGATCAAADANADGCISSSVAEATAGAEVTATAGSAVVTAASDTATSAAGAGAAAAAGATVTGDCRPGLPAMPAGAMPRTRPANTSTGSGGDPLRRTCAPSRRGEAWACSTGREVAGGLPAMRCGGRGGGRPPPPVLMLGRMPSPIASSPLTDLPDPRPPEVTMGRGPLWVRAISRVSLKVRLADICLDISSASPSNAVPSCVPPLTGRPARPGAPLCTVTPRTLPLPARAMPGDAAVGEGDARSRAAKAGKLPALWGRGELLPPPAPAAFELGAPCSTWPPSVRACCMSVVCGCSGCCACHCPSTC
mmetsp:Transcript_12926/g.39135  ORF Transcript_12926/g.39135 Transcript_12926/m.39135 type:complete len:323 (-) Transcript_12926:1729-2697(-)